MKIKNAKNGNFDTIVVEKVGYFKSEKDYVRIRVLPGDRIDVTTVTKESDCDATMSRETTDNDCYFLSNAAPITVEVFDHFFDMAMLYFNL